MNEEYESDDNDLDSEDDSCIAADEEDADEWSVTTRSGRAITRRSEVEFFILSENLEEICAKQLSL